MFIDDLWQRALMKNWTLLAVLNANYIKESLKDLFELPIKGHCMHEFVLMD
jgi:glycine cleavage system protein P-like pyridoxal-binding family